MRLCLLTLFLFACGDPTPRDTDKPTRCDPVTHYPDADRDGYGDPTGGFETCSPDRGVDNALDCDDTDATIHPDAVEDCALDVDMNCDGSVGYADLDADGTAACEDCDDTDATRNPAAAEFCDGVDEDCDGTIDEDPADGRFWYPDADGDTFGSMTDGLRACEQPAGYLEDVSDCDDANAAVHPGATELCNGLDDDCDGSTDDATSADAQIYYVDLDADGYGRDDAAVESCDVPRNHVAVGGDCDDGDAAVSPAATEVCNGLDDDCDGGTDDAGAIDALSWFADADGDTHGDPGAFVFACEVPADGAETGDDCDDTDATAYPGADETCDGVDDDCNGIADDSAVDAPSWYTDADADGYGDAATAVAECTAPAGTLADGTDCDDAAAAVSPGATELCNGTDDDCDGVTDEGDAADATTWYTDTDRDGYGDPTRPLSACTRPSGYVASATDCDDTAAGVSPAAAETCDGKDDDCDGTVDEDAAIDAQTWYADTDGDGYGDAAVAQAGCTAPGGFVGTGTDCDDGDTAFHPGAPEADCLGTVDYNCDGSVGSEDADADGFQACEDCDDATGAVSPAAVEACNAVDDDCDGATDEAGATGGDDWYADADADGYGTPGMTTNACAAPSGYVALDTDCDDANNAVNPDAQESCLTTIDDNCDGDVNSPDALACTDFYFDLDADGYGSTSHDCLCEGEGYLTADNNDDCDDGDEAVYPGADETWGNGIDDDCDDVIDAVTVTDAADATLLGVAGIDFSGGAVAGAGDLNADGYDDVLVGAYGADGGGSSAGAAYVVLGPVTGELGLGSADATLLGETSSDEAGMGLAGVGDIDGDGLDDLLVGAPGGGASTQGTAYLLYGPVTGTIDLSTADATFTGTNTNDYVGFRVGSAGDQDDDGLGDVFVSAFKDDDGGTDAGTVAVWYGTSLTSAVAYGTADALLVGEDRSDTAGRAVASPGDVDGDGIADLLVGAYADDDGGSSAGAAYLVLGPLSGTLDLSLADAKFTGEATNDFAGWDVDGAGDQDGDGHADLLIAAYGAGTAGAAYVVYGGLLTGMDLGSADATIQGDATGQELGYAVAGLGDVDGDGTPDVAVGAFTDDVGGSDAGAAYVLHGPLLGTVSADEAAGTFYGERAGDGLGGALAGAGDVDGDGRSDILLGAVESDTAATNSGATYLLFGR